MPIHKISRSFSESAISTLQEKFIPPQRPERGVHPFREDQFLEPGVNCSYSFVNPTFYQFDLKYLHQIFKLPQYESSFGMPTYIPLHEENVIASIQDLKILIENGEINVNAPIEDSSFSSRYWGYPPLAAAAREPSEVVVRELLKLKTIDVNVRDNRGIDPIPYRTVLMHAVRGALINNSTKVLQLLLDDGRILKSLNHVCVDSTGRPWAAIDLARDYLERYPKSCAKEIIRLLSEK
ncbi:ankyrin repeat domain-containing protein [Candidatus Dependentiae bacterium]|nr:ankyrin repeat domain-containing protein [Candidatus Dependentiae bacterium]